MTTCIKCGGDVRLVGTVSQLLGYASTCKRQNTEEWMEGLLRHINDTLHVIGDDDQIVTFEDGLIRLTKKERTRHE